MSIKVWLDAGHGGKDYGACSNGLIEKDMNLATMKQTRKVLKSHGVIVGTTRMGDSYVSIDDRSKLANAFHANYFVSIHHNAGGGDGQEVIHSIYKGKGLALSKCIEKSIGQLTGQNSRGVYSKAAGNTDYFGVIRDTKMDAIIVECAFLDSKDRTIVDTITEQELMGTAIAEGILTYVGIPVTPLAPPAKKPTGTQAALLKYRVVAKSCTSSAEAMQLQKKLSAKGINNFTEPFTQNGILYHRVIVGTYSNKADAQVKQTQLRTFEFDSFLVLV